MSWEAGRGLLRARHSLRRDETHGAVDSVLAVALDAARRRHASRLSHLAASLPGPLDCRNLAHLVETRHKRVVVLPQSDVFVWLFFLESENRTGRGTVTRTDTVTTGRVSIHSKVVTPNTRRTYHPDLGPAMGVQLDDNVPNLRRHATEVPLGLLALPGWHKACSEDPRTRWRLVLVILFLFGPLSHEKLLVVHCDRGDTRGRVG